ncbi:MAG: type IV secretory system conjugative DNA transfer family protein [Alphaproteobacteria bacterium]|nr:type IV secretory system conjugative DNA transfer family protein [Alphaproteobacteria bacterium]
MIAFRIVSVIILFAALASVLLQWNLSIGFDPVDVRWWDWLLKVLVQTGTLPNEMLYPLAFSFAGMLIVLVVAKLVITRPSTSTINGGPDARNTHGSAAWATWLDVKRTGLVRKTGAIVGGFRRRFKTVPLRHDGPEHIMAFAPTRSGKGVGLVLPTLLTWLESVIVLDIKGENFALSAGWRKIIGHTVLRFDPAAPSGSVRYNPLAEVRVGTDHEIADCQNIASMIIDPDGKGLKDFWMQSGWEWLSAVILHVLYRIRRDDGRTATLADVHAFMSVGHEDEDDMMSGDEGFEVILDDMARFDHGRDTVNGEVHRAAGRMLKRAPQERSGVHSSATVQLALYSDPIVARNTSECDFRISDLMNGDRPTSLYVVIPPSDIQRLRPLIRILMNQFLTRLTQEMEFENGAAKRHYKHRLLLMLDEFTAIGKLEIFEKALAFMAGYGLKAFIIIQDLTQLQKEYGREESVTSNCHVKIAFAPNKIETAKLLSDMTGKTTVVQRKRSKSYGKNGANVSDNLSEVARPLMTPDECMSLSGIRKGLMGRVIPGNMLIFVAGNRPIYGRQWLYFQDKVLKSRAAIPAPAMQNRQAQAPSTEHPDDSEDLYLQKLAEAEGI